MQVKVAQVEAGLFGPGDAQNAVGVGLVVGAQPAGLMHYLHELGDAGVEDAGIFRVGGKKGFENILLD